MEFLDRRPGWLDLLLVVLLVYAAHLPLRHSEYVQDDHLAVEENRIVERGDLAEIFSTSYWAGADGDDRSLYRPVTILSYAWERSLVGQPDAGVSQAVNLGLHCLATLALLWLVHRLGATPFAARATALLFAVHPVHVEAIGNIVGRAEILAALFTFVSLWSLSHAGPWAQDDGGKRAGADGRRRLAAWLAAASLFMALGAKEVAIALPLLLVAVEWLFRPSSSNSRAWWIARLAALAPSALAGVVYLILRVRALEMLVSLQSAHPADNLLVKLDGVARAATAFSLLPRYLGLLLYPVTLSADYSGPAIPVQQSLWLPLPLLGIAALLVLVGLSVAGLRRLPGWNLTSFAALLFVLPYLIVGNLLFTVGTVFAERLIYLPSAGVCLLFGLILGAFRHGLGGAAESERLPHRVTLILAVLLLAFTVRTGARCIDWRNDETVFRAAVNAQPRSARSHFVLGSLHAKRQEYEQAIGYYDRTIELYPQYVAAWFEKGVALGRLGRLGEASEVLRHTVELSPRYAAALLNLGIALRRQQRVDEASRFLRKALAWDPASARGWAELGNLELDARRYAAAAGAYRRAIALGRRDLQERLQLAERMRDAPGGDPGRDDRMQP